jgi:hypothetical protein
MVWNNISFLDNTTSLSAITNGVNDLAGGWLFGGLMIVLFIVGIITFYGRVDISSILIGEGFFLTVVGIIFIALGVLPAWVLGITVAITIFGLLSIFMGNS